MKLAAVLLLALFSVADATNPQQLHIAYGDSPDEMVVAFATPKDVTGHPVVRWSLDASGPLQQIVNASTVDSAAGLFAVHRATLINLTPGTSHRYQAGWVSGGSAEVTWSEEVSFMAQINDTNRPVRLAMFGDLGYTDNQVLPQLAQESAAQAIDAIILYGDMVYYRDVPTALPASEAYGAFMNDVSNMSGGGSIPFMVTPGNGETAGNYSFYRTNFFMPGSLDVGRDTGSLFHSFNLGAAHIIGINSEAWHGGVALNSMMAWLRSDLQSAAHPASRTLRPWIVVHLHRPLYSGNYGKYNDSMYPGGGGDLPVRHGVEAILNEFGVDLVFAGHVHNQECTYPVVNGSLACGTNPEDCYADAHAPVYIISGNPGNTEEANVNLAGFEKYTRWKSYAYGYTHLDIVNKSSVAVEFVSTALGGTVLERVQLSKSRICNFGAHCDHSVQIVPSSPHNSQIDYPRASASALTAHWRNIISARTGPVAKAQVDALVQLYHSTGGNTTWRHTDNWLVGDPCANGWYGVGCLDVTDRLLGKPSQTHGNGITALMLPSNDLTGEFPGDDVWVPLASTLQILELSHNLLTGTLPTSLFRLHGVHSLFLEPKFDHIRTLRLKGTLPQDLGDATGMPNLRFLSTNRHALSGSLPASFGNSNCTTVQASPTAPSCNYWLMDNNLDGLIPLTMCKPTWGELYLSNNSFTCPYPTCIKAEYSNYDKCP